MAPKPEDLEIENFTQIVSAHEGAVRAFIAVRLEDPFEAHDLAQEVFLIFWRRLEEIDLNQPLRPWLMGVAANLIRDHRRKGRAVPIGGNDEVLDFLSQRIEETNSLEGPVFQALEQCLEKLDRNGRNLIQWRYRDGLGIREIRERTGANHSAITMKLHRLRSLLLDCIRQHTKEAVL